MADILDRKKRVLYCSTQCAVEDGAEEEDLEEIHPDEYNTEDYGALCPTCETTYASF